MSHHPSPLVLLPWICAPRLACAWGFLAKSQTGKVTWLIILANGKVDDDGTELRNFDSASSKYLASLHYAVMTLTTVGYGDIAPQSDVEYGFSALVMTLGAVIWAYLLGKLTSIMTNLNPQRTKFENIMDDLNRMMSEYRIDPELRSRVRMFWRRKQNL